MQFTLSLVVTLLLAVVSSVPTCPPCDPASCSGPPLSCRGGTIQDSCGCCEVCAKTIGEECSPGQCDSAAGLICIPDDPYAIEQTGICQEFSSCLTFGCDVENGQCQCRYSSTCPVYKFTYNNLDDCEEDLQRLHSCQSGDGIIPHNHEVQLDPCTTCLCNNGSLVCLQQTCPVLEYCEGGESFTPEGTCCPVCSPKTTLATNCVASDGNIYSDGARWKPNTCTSCRCFNGQSVCSSIQCEPVKCQNPTFLPDVCCPVCPDEIWPSSSTQNEISSTSVSATTTSSSSYLVPSPSPTMAMTIEIAVILDIPFKEYESEKPGLLQELKYLLGRSEVGVDDMKASPYGEFQTYLMVLASADMTDTEVVSIVSEGTKHNSMVVKVGTVSEISTDSGFSSKEEPGASSSNGGSTESTTVAVVLAAVSLVAVISIVGSIIAAMIIIVRIRRQQVKKMNSDKSAQMDSGTKPAQINNA